MSETSTEERLARLEAWVDRLTEVQEAQADHVDTFAEEADQRHAAMRQRMAESEAFWDEAFAQMDGKLRRIFENQQALADRMDDLAGRMEQDGALTSGTYDALRAHVHDPEAHQG